jgi:hypothetical protein
VPICAAAARDSRHHAARADGTYRVAACVPDKEDSVRSYSNAGGLVKKRARAHAIYRAALGPAICSAAAARDRRDRAIAGVDRADPAVERVAYKNRVAYGADVKAVGTIEERVCANAVRRARLRLARAAAGERRDRAVESDCAHAVIVGIRDIDDTRRADGKLSWTVKERI